MNSRMSFSLNAFQWISQPKRKNIYEYFRDLWAIGFDWWIFQNFWKKYFTKFFSESFQFFQSLIVQEFSKKNFLQKFCQIQNQVSNFYLIKSSSLMSSSHLGNFFLARSLSIPPCPWVRTIFPVHIDDDDWQCHAQICPWFPHDITLDKWHIFHDFIPLNGNEYEGDFTRQALRVC